MGLDPNEIKAIARGAFLHDIGKMAIPDEILRKPGKLTPEEQEVMREHCTRGYYMLRKIPFLAGAAEIVFCHQEFFDGSGYPSGLHGSEIPIGARIFAVADTLDASPATAPTAAPAALTPPVPRFSAVPAPSLTQPSSKSSSACPMSSGRNYDRKSSVRTGAFPILKPWD
jgi:hypothetical protein